MTADPPTAATPEDPALPELGFVVPVPGLGASRRFALTAIDDDGVLFTLESRDDETVRLIVAQPWAFFPDYAPEIDDDWAAALGLAAADDALVFVVLTVGATLHESTANLLAPVVVHRRTGAAAQIVLPSTDLPLRAPLAG